MAKIGFIGLGIMGTPMARHLQDAGHQLFTSRFNPPPRQELIDNGLQILETPKAVAEECDTIILMLPDTPQVAEVIFGEGGAIGGLGKGKLLIDMSSISLSRQKSSQRRSAQPAVNMSMRRFPAARSARRMPASPSWLAARRNRSTALCRS